MGETEWEVQPHLVASGSRPAWLSLRMLPDTCRQTFRPWLEGALRRYPDLAAATRRDGDGTFYLVYNAKRTTAGQLEWIARDFSAADISVESQHLGAILGYIHPLPEGAPFREDQHLLVAWYADNVDEKRVGEGGILLWAEWVPLDLKEAADAAIRERLLRLQEELLPLGRRAVATVYRHGGEGSALALALTRRTIRVSAMTGGILMGPEVPLHTSCCRHCAGKHAEEPPAERKTTNS